MMNNPRRVELQPAYLLHKRPYRDTSLIIDVLTVDYGQISLVAKGARKPKSQQAYLLQSFVPVLISYTGLSSLKTLIHIEAQTSHIKPENLRGERLYSALYANELLSYVLSPEDPNETIFHHYEGLLEQLVSTDLPIEPLLRVFEFSLLDDLGYGINFFQEADTDEEILAEMNYFFVDNHGFVRAEKYPELKTALFSGEALINIAQQHYSDKVVLHSAKLLARQSLKPLLRGKEIKSRELFK